jgi:Domain of Unknown Function (DUF928)
MKRRLAALTVSLAAALVLSPAIAQTPEPSQGLTAPASGALYKPPLRGAPGGRVGGASRGDGSAGPTIELIAPANHTGQTASATPVLYFFVSQPITVPTQLTISAPLQPAPVLETTLASPPGRGLHAMRLADYHVQLQLGIVYSWSISAVTDPKDWSRNAVASATIERVVLDPQLDNAVRAAQPAGRAALFARAGLWYDAIAAAAENASLDRHAALDELLTEGGLTEPGSFDRAAAGGTPGK